MEINLLATAVAAIVGIIIGAVWFGPKTFFPHWWKFLGKNPSEQPGTDNMAVIFGSTTVAAIVQAVVMSVVIGLAEQATGGMNTITGLAIGALMGVGFAASASVSHHLFGGFPIKAWVLEAGQDIVALAAMGAIIASF
jgi:hypothetical protein